MSRNKYLIGLSIILSFILVWSSSCKKKKEFKDEDCQDLVDCQASRAENDVAISDVNYLIMERPLLHGRNEATDGYWSGTKLCGASLDSSQISEGIFRLVYDGTVCNNRKREGIIMVSILAYPLKKWKNQGCVLNIQYFAYKVTNLNSGRSVQFDGTQSITNESGGTWYDLKYLHKPGIVHSTRASDLKVSFNGGDYGIYNMSRRATYSMTDTVVNCKLEGTGSDGNNSDIESWGLTRNGIAFTSRVTSSILWSSACGIHSPTNGALLVKVDGKPFDLNASLGTDSNGNSFSGGAGNCSYGFRVNWAYKRKSLTRVFPYN